MPAQRLFSRTIVRLSPQADDEDVADFLQGLVTQDVTGELPAWAGLLTPQGKTLFDFIVWPAGHGELLIDCEADAAGDLIRRLSMYRLRRKICIEQDDTLGVYWQPELGDGGAPDPRLHDLGQRWIAKASADDESADDAWRKHRLALGVPEGRAEMADILWLETNAAELNGVSFSKGCYVGQENTARMNWRQKVNRRLIVMPLVSADEARSKAAYPELGLAVVHMRVSELDPAMLPHWLAEGEAGDN
jgi:folate-binding protein YgfZ